MFGPGSIFIRDTKNYWWGAEETFLKLNFKAQFVCTMLFKNGKLKKSKKYIFYREDFSGGPLYIEQDFE
jgi:hypothetical protein